MDIDGKKAWTNADGKVLVNAEGRVYVSEECCCGETPPLDCDGLKSRLAELCAQNGGTSYAEGFVCWWTGTPHDSGSFEYEKFLAACSWSDDDGGHVSYIPCSCSGIVTEALTADMSLHEMPDVCDPDTCELAIMFRRTALDNGWTMHGEGILAERTEAVYDEASGEYVTAPWFHFHDNGQDWDRYLACAESQDRYYLLDCQCEEVTSVGKSDRVLFIPYAGACSGCVDARELALEYPDVFGIVAISWGSNTKARLTSTTAGGGTRTEVVMCGSDSFLEYRMFCFIRHNEDGYRLNYLAPHGSPYATGADLGRNADRIEFIGHAEPFRNDADLNRFWKGNIVLWTGSSTHEDGVFDTVEEAREFCSAHDPDPAVDVYGSTQPWVNPNNECPPAVLTPDTTPGEVQSTIYDSTAFGDPRQRWYCIGKHYIMGEYFLHTTGYEYFLVGDFGVVYHVRWLQTNRGILVMGRSGWTDSLLVYGINGQTGNPSWSGRGVPLQDTTYDATLVDDGMYPCPGHDPDWTPEEEEEDGEE